MVEGIAPTAYKTYNGLLYLQGFKLIAQITNQKLKEGLVNILFAEAEGKFSDIKIIPLEAALRGYAQFDNCELKAREPTHFVYVKPNPNSLVRHEFSFNMSGMIGLKNNVTGESLYLFASDIK